MLKYNLPKRTDKKVDYQASLNLAKAVSQHDKLTFDKNSFNVLNMSNGQFVTLAPQIIYKTPADFKIASYSVTDDNLSVTIYGGDVTIGITKVTCLDTILVLTASESYVGWEYSYSAGTLEIVNFGSTFSLDDAYIRRCLYYFKKETGANTPTLKRIKHNSITYPANFSV